MWTNNGIIINKNSSCGLTSPSVSIFGNIYNQLSSNAPTSIELVDIGGNTRYIAGFQVPYVVAHSPVFSVNSAGWHCGSGTTPASVNDYKIESPITSSSSGAFSESATKQFINGKYHAIVTITFTASEAITVSEIANYIYMNASSYQGGSGSSYYFCVFRETFTPVTLNAGDVLVITIDATMPE